MRWERIPDYAIFSLNIFVFHHWGDTYTPAARYKPDGGRKHFLTRRERGRRDRGRSRKTKRRGEGEVGCRNVRPQTVTGLGMWETIKGFKSSKVLQIKSVIFVLKSGGDCGGRKLT